MLASYRLLELRWGHQSCGGQIDENLQARSAELMCRKDPGSSPDMMYGNGGPLRLGYPLKGDHRVIEVRGSRKRPNCLTVTAAEE